MALGHLLATVGQLDGQVLADLFDGKYIAIRVPEFYPSDYCKNLAELLHRQIGSEPVTGGIYESDIDSFWNVANDEERLERYFAGAFTVPDRLRRLSAPHPSPADLFRLALDDAWPSGATLMTLQGRKMPFGISRLWRQGSQGLPHQDVLWREVAPGTLPFHPLGQLGVNIYVDTADEGGELEAWDFVITDAEYENLRDRYPGSYGYAKGMLPQASLSISPGVGDLVMVNTLRVHAIRCITRGRRITVSGFVVNAGTDQPLRCWS